MKKLLKGGVIVGASGCRKADLLIDGERIEAVGEALSCPEAEEIDVSGKLLFPGFLDAHTHFDLEVCNTVTADINEFAFLIFHCILKKSPFTQ